MIPLSKYLDDKYPLHCSGGGPGAKHANAFILNSLKALKADLLFWNLILGKIIFAVSDCEQIPRFVIEEFSPLSSCVCLVDGDGINRTPAVVHNRGVKNKESLLLWLKWLDVCTTFKQQTAIIKCRIHIQIFTVHIILKSGLLSGI